MNEIENRNFVSCNFHCYSFLCIQYQNLSSDTTNIISSVLIGSPYTQHCLQEKSTCILLLTEHFKLCHRKCRHRCHNMIENYIYDHFSIIFITIIVIIIIINSSSGMIVISTSSITIIIVAIVIAIAIIIITINIIIFSKYSLIYHSACWISFTRSTLSFSVQLNGSHRRWSRIVNN